MAARGARVAAEHCDAALLRVPGDRAGDAAGRLGRVGGNERVACRALGFPFAQAKKSGGLRDTEDIAGEIAPLTGPRADCLTVHIAGSVPTPAGRVIRRGRACRARRCSAAR